MDLLPSFEKFELAQILAGSKVSKLLIIEPIEHLIEPTIAKENEVMWIGGMPLWMQPILAYLKDQVFHDNNEEAYKL